MNEDLAEKDDWESAQLDSIADFQKDFANGIGQYFGIAGGFAPGYKDKLYKEVFLPAAVKHFPVLELLKESGSGFFGKRGPSWEDFYISITRSLKGMLTRDNGVTLALLNAANSGDTLRILVENRGRDNYWTSTYPSHDKKSLFKVTLDGAALQTWFQCGINLTEASVNSLTNSFAAENEEVLPEKAASQPGVFIGTFSASALTDTFFDSTSGAKFANSNNAEIHYKTTGPEIWQQTNGKVDLCCLGVGSGGTLTGVGTYLKEKNSNIKMFAVEPYESSVLNGLPAATHMIAGLGAGLIPEILNRSLFDEAIRIKGDNAIAMAKRLALEEGLLVGISSGANVCSAIELAKRPENAGKLIVTIAPSYGERYLSTVLYKDIKLECDKMDKTTLEEDIEYLQNKGFISKN